MGFETPHMVVDLDQIRRNIVKVQSVSTQNGKQLRPHSKTHKIPYLSKLQIDAGANGVCVQKISEAEVMFRGSIKDILLSNEIIGGKFNRVSDLIQKGCNIIVALDNSLSVAQFEKSCEFYEVEGHVMIDVNIGMNRCGIDPPEFKNILEVILNSKQLVLEGIMAYDGQVNYPDLEKRKEEVKRESLVLEPLVKLIKDVSNSNPKVSVGGTPTWEIWSQTDIATELQPGTYIYYDTHCMNLGLCSLNEIAIGVVSTVISEKRGERIVLDAGYKSVSLDQGVFPIILDYAGNEYKVLGMSEEHTVLKARNNSSKLGEKLIMLPYHSCTTTDLWDGTYAISSNRPPEYLIIQGRGKRE
jgi:D-serine deaminase-like pyridoxal phosphate-dependent protein